MPAAGEQEIQTGQAPASPPVPLECKLKCPRCRGTGIYEYDYTPPVGDKIRRKVKCYRCANTSRDPAKGFQNANDLLKNRLNDRKRQGISWVVGLQFTSSRDQSTRVSHAGFSHSTETWVKSGDEVLLKTAAELKPGDVILTAAKKNPDNPNEDAILVEATVVSLEHRVKPEIGF